MRQELQDFQTARQQQQILFTQQQTQITEARTRAEAAERERADMTQIATQLAANANESKVATFLRETHIFHEQ